jgi:hypothetical protein
LDKGNDINAKMDFSVSSNLYFLGHVVYSFIRNNVSKNKVALRISHPDFIVTGISYAQTSSEDNTFESEGIWS